MNLDHLKKLAGLAEAEPAPAMDVRSAFDLAYKECLKMEEHYHNTGQKEKESAASACAEAVRQLRFYWT